MTVWWSSLAPFRMVAAWLLLCVSVAAGIAAEDLDAQVRTIMGGRTDLEIAAPDNRGIGTVTRDGRALAHFASSHALLQTVGYSGLPVDVLVVVNPAGTIIGAKLLRQTEPILTLGIPPEALDRFVEGFAGSDAKMSVRALRDGGDIPDAVSGATVSSGVIGNAILQTARQIGAHAGKRGTAVPDRETTAATDWPQLVESGRVALRTVSFADIRAALPGARSLPEGDGIFVEVAVAKIESREAGAALIGAAAYDEFATEFAAGDTLLLVAARGVYSVKGTSWKRTGTFERLEIVSGDTALPLPADGHRRIDKLAVAAAPDFREIMLVALPAGSGPGADAPLTLRLIVDKTKEGAAAPARFDLGIGAAGSLALPSEAQAAATQGNGTPDAEPLWMENWRSATPQLSILAVMLAVLFLALYISGPIVRRPALYGWFRAVFLTVTLVWLGFIAGAQLSVVQVVAFFQSLITGFRWDVFLLAPLIFVLWAFVALGVLFWGRGVYCGWLCPFGALQELIYKAGQKAGIKRIEVPWEVHERLWPLKYVALLAIVGLSLQNPALAFMAAEVEPFKTAIVMHFLRAWPYVGYVLVLLVIGLFVERAFCRYLCPLGAALALPSKFKIFDWLIRRPQCGRECRLCATTCPVQAIDPIGRINPNECIYCLKCQVNYHDANTCIPLKMRANRRVPGSAAEPASTASEIAS